MRLICAAAVSLSLLAACKSDDVPVAVDGNPGGQTYTLTWGPIDVPPLTEDTRCVTMRLGNDIPVKIHQIHNTLGATSHHFIVYRVEDGEENLTPEPCFPFVDTLDPTKGAPLMITQKMEEDLVLPDGVAFTLQPDQMIRLEMHFINPSTTETLSATATSELFAMADADFVYEADFLFIGNPDIDLPSSPSVQTLGPTWFPVPASLHDAQIFAVTGHTHHLGVDVDVAVGATPESADQMIYDPIGFSWSEPETVFHDPPVVVPDGGGFKFNCSWMNDTGQRVGFGESVDDEMCFFWAYYYPSQGSKVCMHSEAYTDTPLDICCPDDEVLCALAAEYIDGL